MVVIQNSDASEAHSVNFHFCLKQFIMILVILCFGLDTLVFSP